MILRQVIAYGLMAVLVISISTWAWLQHKRKRDDLRWRHGPRED